MTLGSLWPLAAALAVVVAARAAIWWFLEVPLP
jgi:hypothetical protein